MKYFILTATLLLTSTTWARPVPDLVYRETRFIFVDPISLDVQKRESTTVYHFKSGSLYIKPIDRGEYRYNKVVEVESMRYTSGQKVFQFGGGDGF